MDPDFAFRGSPHSIDHLPPTPQVAFNHMHPLVIQSRTPAAYHTLFDFPANWPVNATEAGPPPLNMITPVENVFSPPQPAFPMAITLPPASRPRTQDNNIKLKEKKHGCQLCDKRFDRPSTLKKHLLVHTGEKAWVCDICNRRFGVSSNLNRHYRRCRQKWLEGRVAGISESPSSSTMTAPSLSPPLSEQAYSPPSAADLRSDGRRNSPNDNCIVPPTARSSPSYKRPRRAPSPIRQWVPNSLRSFDLTLKSIPVAPAPLPPVVKSMYEERDSYDENVNDNPYRSSDWKGRLVGPCYTANHTKDLRAYQRILVF